MRTINGVICLTFALAVLASLEMVSQVQAASPTPDGSYSNFITAGERGQVDALKVALGDSGRSLFSRTTDNFNVTFGLGVPASTNADPTYNFNNSQFHGWWRNTMIGAMNGFNAGGPYSALQDQYIYIDTSV